MHCMVEGNYSKLHLLHIFQEPQLSKLLDILILGCIFLLHFSVDRTNTHNHEHRFSYKLDSDLCTLADSGHCIDCQLHHEDRFLLMLLWRLMRNLLKRLSDNNPKYSLCGFINLQTRLPLQVARIRNIFNYRTSPTRITCPYQLTESKL